MEKNVGKSKFVEIAQDGYDEVKHIDS